jgi:predicted nucleic acid-binding protein
MLFIYWLEAHPKYAPFVGRIHQTMSRRGDQLCTGVFTIGEVLTGPYKAGSLEGARKLAAYFSSGSVMILPFDAAAAERYAQIRAKYGVTPADAIHLATASVAGVDLYVTNDDKLRTLAIDGIKFIAGLDGNIF